jgi:hypothetical protein
MEDIMEFPKWVNMDEYLKHEFTPEEQAERMEKFRKVCQMVDEANAESPLPDDIMDDVKGPGWKDY